MTARQVSATVNQSSSPCVIDGAIRCSADIDVSVRDTGPGVPAHILDRLFTPFVTTKREASGSA